MVSYKHFVITRFNLTENLESLDKEWHEKRIKLFKEYCAPSIFNQDCKNFEWLVYLDPETKDIYKNEFQEILKNFPCSTSIRYVKGKLNFKKDIRSYISNVVPIGDVAITTRLDTDDAFHQCAIDKIQKTFKENQLYLKDANSFAINLTKVYQLRVTPFYELVKKKIPSNMFISLVEVKNDNNSLKGVYSCPHPKVKEFATTLNIEDNVYCLQTIHDQNRLSSLQGWPVFNKKRLTEFGFKVNPININKRFLEQIYMRVLNSRFGKVIKKLKI